MLVVGTAGFEPATPCSQSRCADQAAPRPVGPPAERSEARLPDMARSFERHLGAENKSDRTVETYLEAVRLLQAYLARRGVGLADAARWLMGQAPPKAAPRSRRGWPHALIALDQGPRQGRRPPADMSMTNDTTCRCFATQASHIRAATRLFASHNNPRVVSDLRR